MVGGGEIAGFVTRGVWGITKSKLALLTCVYLESQQAEKMVDLCSKEPFYSS